MADLSVEAEDDLVAALEILRTALSSIKPGSSLVSAAMNQPPRIEGKS